MQLILELSILRTFFPEILEMICSNFFSVFEELLPRAALKLPLSLNSSSRLILVSTAILFQQYYVTSIRKRRRQWQITPEE